MEYNDIKGLDVKKGLAIVANNKTVYIRLLKSFAGNSFCDKIIEAVNSGDPEQIRHNAHSLKGVAGNMHMDELFELSRAIESAAKDGVAVSAGDENVVKIIEANRQTMESVNMLLAQPEILDTL